MKKVPQSLEVLFRSHLHTCICALATVHLRIYIAQSQRRSYLFVHLHVYIYIAYLFDASSVYVFDTSSVYEFAPRFLFNELAHCIMWFVNLMVNLSSNYCI